MSEIKIIKKMSEKKSSKKKLLKKKFQKKNYLKTGPKYVKKCLKKALKYREFFLILYYRMFGSKEQIGFFTTKCSFLIFLNKFFLAKKFKV